MVVVATSAAASVSATPTEEEGASRSNSLACTPITTPTPSSSKRGVTPSESGGWCDVGGRVPVRTGRSFPSSSELLLDRRLGEDRDKEATCEPVERFFSSRASVTTTPFRSSPGPSSSCSSSSSPSVALVPVLRSAIVGVESELFIVGDELSWSMSGVEILSSRVAPCSRCWSCCCLCPLKVLPLVSTIDRGALVGPCIEEREPPPGPRGEGCCCCCCC